MSSVPFLIMRSLATVLALLAVPRVVLAETSEATVRLCEAPNPSIREAVRFELLARQERVAACEVAAPITLRIVFEDTLRGGFVEVRSGSRTLQTRLPGPLDTLDDRAVAVTAAALVESVRRPATSGEAEEEPVEAAPIEADPGDALQDTSAEAATGSTAPENAAEPETSEPETAEPETPERPYVSYLDVRHVGSFVVGTQNIERSAAFAAALSYGAMPSANVRIGTQLALALGRGFGLRVDLRGTYVWHHGAWTTELGGQVVGSLRSVEARDGVDAGGGLGLHGGATRYVSEHFGFLFAVEANGLYMRAVSDSERGLALELSLWAGVRYGP